MMDDRHDEKPTRVVRSDRDKWIKDKNVLASPYYDRHIAWAVRAVQAGKATSEQQKLAWDWMMYVTAATPEFQDLSFRLGPDAERATSFAEGKRWVGSQLLKMCNPALDAVIHKEIEAEVAADVAKRRRQKSEGREDT